MKTASNMLSLQNMLTKHHKELWLCYWRKLWSVFVHIVSCTLYFHYPQSWKIQNWSMLLLNMAPYPATFKSKKKKGQLKNHQYKPMPIHMSFTIQRSLNVKFKTFFIDCHFCFVLFWVLFPSLLWQPHLSLSAKASGKKVYLCWPFYKGLFTDSSLSDYGDLELLWVQRLITHSLDFKSAVAMHLWTRLNILHPCDY